MISRTPLLSMSSFVSDHNDTTESEPGALIEEPNPRTLNSNGEKRTRRSGNTDRPPRAKTGDPLPTPMPGTNLTLDDPFDDTNFLDTENAIETELPLRTSCFDQPVPSIAFEDTSFPSNDEDTKCVENEITTPLDRGPESQGYFGDIESNDEIERGRVISTSDLNDPKVLIMSSSSSTAKRSVPGKDCQRASPLPLSETQNRLLSPKMIDKGLSERQMEPPHLKSILSSSPSRTTSQTLYSADADYDEVELPTLGSHKFWLEVQHERASRYSEVISESSDEDEHQGARFSQSPRVENTAPRAFARVSAFDGWGMPNSRSSPIVSDENVSPLALSSRTPSPAGVPLPTSESVPKRSPWIRSKPHDLFKHQGYPDKPDRESASTSVTASAPDEAALPANSPSKAGYPATSKSTEHENSQSAAGSMFSVRNSSGQNSLPRLSTSALAPYDPKYNVDISKNEDYLVMDRTRSETLSSAGSLDDVTADSDYHVVRGSEDLSQLLRSSPRPGPGLDRADTVQEIHDNSHAAEQGRETNSSTLSTSSASADHRRVSLLNRSFPSSPAPPILNLRDELAGTLTPQRAYSGEVSSDRSENVMTNSDWDEVELHTSGEYRSVIGQAMRSLRIPSDGLSPTGDSGRRVMNAFRFPSPSGDSESLDDGRMLERSRGRGRAISREWNTNGLLQEEEEDNEEIVGEIEW